MDRTIISPLEQARDFDYVEGNHDTLIGLAATMEDALGSVGTVVSGLAATPASPASMVVNIGAGRIYQLAAADATADGSIPQDLTMILQQGLAAPQTVSLTTTGLSSGQSRWVLIQATFSQVDAIRANDPTGGSINFYNAANPSQPNVATVNTVRQGLCDISVVYGAIATTGSEVPPSASAGNVGLYYIDLTYGQTQITSGDILVAGPSVGAGVPYAPFLAGLLNSHHGGIPGQAPQIKLGSEVQGVLPVANGGTGSETGAYAALSGATFTGSVAFDAGLTGTTADLSGNVTVGGALSAGSLSSPTLANYAALNGSETQTFQVATGTSGNDAVNLNQIDNALSIEPMSAYSAQGTSIGANYNQTLTLSFTAPVAGYVKAWAYLNPGGVAAAAIETILAINGSLSSTDTSTVSQSHFNQTSVASGAAVSVTYNVTTTTSPSVTATYGLMVEFTPQTVY